MVNFSLGTLDVDAALATLPALADLIHDKAPADADVLGEYTWFEKALTGNQTDTTEAVNNTNAAEGWRKLFRVKMDSEDLDNVESTDLTFQTNKESWVMEDGASYSSTGAAATRFNMMTDVTVNDLKSSNKRAGYTDRGIGKDFISSMANEVMGLKKSGRGSYDVTGVATADIFTNEVAILADLEGATDDANTAANVNSQIRDAQRTILDDAGDANTDRDGAGNLAARVFDQLLSNDDGDRDRLTTRLGARAASGDFVSLLEAGDIIYFTLNIQPSSGSDSANVGEKADSAGNGPQQDTEPATGVTNDADNVADQTDESVVAPINIQSAAASRQITNVKYMIKITLAQGVVV